MNDRIRYTRQNIISNHFYQLPKFLFDAEFTELSNDARVLYTLLRNRHEISIKNEWYDENGEVFLYFKRDDMQSILNLSGKTVTKAMKDLKDFRLLEEVRQGVSKPNKIYLLSALAQPFGIETAETLENTVTRKFYASRHVNFTGQETEILRPNHNYKIHNNVIQNPVMSSQSEVDGRGEDKTDGAIRQIEAYAALIKENIGYSDLAVSRPYDMKLVDEMIDIIIDTVLTEGKFVRIGGEDKPRALVTRILLKLTYGDIEHAIDQFKGVKDRITKKKPYILTTLYNCKLEHDSHYTNLVKHEMWNGGDC